MMMGKLIALEGQDGVGKTTVLQVMAGKLTDKGYDVVCTREPGGTKLAEGIRRMLLDPESEIEPYAEALLYASARSQHIADVILPALLSGKIVLCDRFVDSSFAYQGYGKGVGLEFIRAINKPIVDQIGSFLTILLSIDPEISMRRISGKPDRMEGEGLGFQRKVANGYRLLQRSFPRIRLVDASLSIEEVSEQAVNLALNFLNGVIPGRVFTRF